MAAPAPERPSRLLRALLFAIGALFTLEATTGLSLALVFSPSTTHAWSSVAWFQRAATWGPFVRALHHHAATALVLCALAALVLAIQRGVFRAHPKVWVCGLVGFGLVLAISHTGELLPADQRAYAATVELFSILGSVPLLGPSLVALVRGGPRYGHLTLTHLYAFHVLLLPWCLALLVAGGFVLSRRRTASIPAASRPRDFQMELTFATGVLLVVAVAALLRKAPLWAPADPSGHFPGRPEWYFLPIFQLRRHLGRAEVLATLVLPGVVFLALCGLPWLDGWARRRGKEIRHLAFGAALVGLAAATGVGFWSVAQDAGDSHLRALRADAKTNAAEALRLARLGTPWQGPLALDLNDPIVHGKHLFARHCSSCHANCAARPDGSAPCLEGYGSRAWIAAFLRNPSSPYFFGRTKVDDMDPYPASGTALPALVEFLYRQTGAKGADPAKAAQGEKAFADAGCESCHSLDGKGTEIAPDLRGWGSKTWLSAFIRAPGDARFYGDDNHMKSFSESRLSEADLAAVVAYLRSRSEQAHPMKFLLPSASKSGSLGIPEVPRK